jgi:hypothetical protein
VVELAHLYLDLDRPQEARDLLSGRTFQPWEGGEGQALGAWDRTHLALARRAIARGDGAGAVELVGAALDPPASIGEARHPLSNPALLLLVRGDAQDLAGDRVGATASWRRCAEAVGDFRSMSTQPYGEATFASILARHRLGETIGATRTATGLAAYCDELEAAPATVDYFATSLPTMLLFTADLRAVTARRVALLRAQLDVLAGDRPAAVDRLEALLAQDPAQHAARDLLRDLTEWAPLRTDGAIPDVSPGQGAAR